MSTAVPRKGFFYGWTVLGVAFFTLFVAMGSRSGFGVFVVPMSEEFGWSRGTISAAIAFGWLMNGLTQPLIGRLYDRYGGRKIISTGLFVLGISTILLSQTNNILFLAVVYGLVVSVAAGGCSLVTTHALLARWFYRKRGVVLSVSTSGGSAGSLLLVPFTAYVIILADWRVAWLVLGAMTLFLALPLALLLIRDDPAELGLQPDGDGGGPGRQRSTTAKPRPRGPLEADNWRDSYRSSPMWQLTGAFFVCGMTTAIISAHYVPFAIDRGRSPATAALAFGLMSGLNTVGSIGVGIASDRVGRKYLLGTMYAVRGLAYAVLVLMPGALGIWAFAVVAGVSWIATAPLTSSLTADIYGLKTLGTLNGMASLAHQVGGALSVYLGGVLYDLLGAYDVPFAIAGVMLAGASVAAFSIRETRYSARYQHQQPEAAPSPGDGD